MSGRLLLLAGRVRRPALVVFGVALAVRVAILVVCWRSYSPAIVDSYDVIARNVLDGHGFSYVAGRAIPTVARAPGYVAYLVVVMGVVGERFWVLRLFEGALDAGTAVVVYALVARYRSRWSGRTGEWRGDEGLPLVAGLVYALQPYSAWSSVKLGSETLFCLVLAVSLLLFLHWLAAPGALRALGLGAALGALTLNKSTGLVVMVLWVVLGLILSRRTSPWRTRLAFALIVPAVVLVLVLPWEIRDYRVTDGAVVPVQTLTWFTFWTDFTGPGTAPWVMSHFPERHGHPQSLSAPDDAAQEAHLRREALRWIRGNPDVFAAKALRNAAEFWYLTDEQRVSRRTLAWSVVVLCLAGLGVVTGWRSDYRSLIVVCAATVVAFDAVYAPVAGICRYSLVVQPQVSVLMAVGLVLGAARLARRCREQPSAS